MPSPAEAQTAPIAAFPLRWIEATCGTCGLFCLVWLPRLSEGWQRRPVTDVVASIGHHGIRGHRSGCVDCLGGSGAQIAVREQRPVVTPECVVLVV